MDDLDRKIARALIAETRNLRDPTPFDAVKAALSLCDARYQPRADAPCRHGTNSCRLRGLEHDRDRCIASGQPHADVKPEAPAKDGARWPFPCAPIDDAEREAVASPGPSACGASAPTNAVVCTRRDAHDGDHVASDGRQVLNRWPSTKPAAPAPDDATEEAIGIVAGWQGATRRDLIRDLNHCRGSINRRIVNEIAAALRRRSEVRIGTGAIPRTLLHTSQNGCQWYGERDRSGAPAVSWSVGSQSAGMGMPEEVFRALVRLMARDGEGR